MIAADWGALQDALAGEVLLPDAPGYDAARAPAIANFAHLRPRAVVRCAAAEDVAQALAFARRFGIEVAPRSGGHCFAGRSSTDGIVVDVTPMRSVAVSGSAATIGGGARLAGVYDALQAHALTLPAGCGPTVGIAGLTLGGGLGVLGRAYGLTCDRLRAARVVLADGRIVDCDEDHDGELFWALRGGGGRFGVVTSLVFDAVPAPGVTAFRVAWPPAAAAAVVAAWQEWAPAAPDELHAGLQLAVRDGTVAVELSGAMLAGESETAALVDQLAVRARVDPASAAYALRPYNEAKRWLSGEDGEPRHRFGRSELFSRSLPAEAIDALVANLQRSPGAGEVNFLPLGGAYNRVPARATAFAHRDQRFLVEHVCYVDRDERLPAEDGSSTAMQWVLRSWGCVHPWGSGRVYPNFPEPGLADWDAAYYAVNRERLLRVKRTYDPQGVLRRPRASR